jgi:hypothetical protein
LKKYHGKDIMGQKFFSLYHPGAENSMGNKKKEGYKALST